MAPAEGTPHPWDRIQDGPYIASASEDLRTPTERDRDRILYAPAFRRLANVTQVVSPTQGIVVHNRLTHSLKVAQLAQRLAEALGQRQEREAKALGLDKHAAEAAALAHDLGHPPFGHIAERKLCELLDAGGARAGYEGNAQSFRIVTVLEEQPRANKGGLDLTRRTLNALLKYPWLRESEGPRGDKWGAYWTEQDQLKWARELHPPGNDKKSVEAELMDWADDVAYSVHDLEDFYRGGLIPLDRLSIANSMERKTFEDHAVYNIGDKDPEWKPRKEVLREAFKEILLIGAFEEPYNDTRSARESLHKFSSLLITRYLAAPVLQSNSDSKATVMIDDASRAEVLMLKQLTWQYVIDNPDMAIMQRGQRQVIEQLFTTYIDAAENKNDWRLFPKAWNERLDADTSSAGKARIVADFISSLTERQALRLTGRLSGHLPTSLVEMAGF